MPSAEETAAVADFFEPEDLGAYSWKQRISIRAMAFGYWALIGLICPTLRWELRGLEHLEAIHAAGRLPIISFFHSRILTMTWFWRRRGTVVMTSKSFDGEAIARCIQRFGYGASRGSSSRGAVGALIGINRALRAGYEAAITVDGPKGPIHEVKPGAAAAAHKTGHVILPMTVVVSRRWEIGSWDRFQIPKPFARALAVFAPPIAVSRDAGDDAVERGRAALQDALDDLRRQYD